MTRVGVFHDSVTELKTINRVQTLHKVVTISDISTADSRILNLLYLKNSACSAIRNTTLWQSKRHFVSSDFTTWKTYSPNSTVHHVTSQISCPQYLHYQTNIATSYRGQKGSQHHCCCVSNNNTSHLCKLHWTHPALSPTSTHSQYIPTHNLTIIALQHILQCSSTHYPLHRYSTQYFPYD